MPTRPDLARTVLQQLAAEIRAGRQVGRMPHVVGQTLMAVLAGLEATLPDGSTDETAGR